MSATEIDTEAPALLELKFNQDPDGNVDSTIEVTWCLHHDLLPELDSRGFVDPHLLLVVGYPRQRRINDDHVDITWYDTKRHLVPLTGKKEFVSFKHAGENRIVAMIVDKAKANKKFYKQVFD